MGRNKKKSKTEKETKILEQRDRLPRAPIPIGEINDNFINYYRAILVPTTLSEDEFQEMLAKYRTLLPSSFRLSTAFPQYKKVEAEMNEFFEKIKAEGIEIEEYKVFPPENGRIYKVAMDKTIMRRDERFKPFRNWLNLQTDLGRCSRQEFVSMIPPYFLDIQPNDTALDLCAAPGSKTAQIVEMLDGGYIFANDVDPRRCHNLVHQLQRVGTQKVLVTCQEAQYYDTNGVQFDKVLCDVPCTGDGTLRKNGIAGSKWTPKGAGSLHGTQRLILKRGLELTKPGGYCVYSTCSMNPIENEAVVNSVCLETKGAVEIVDCSSRFPNFKRHPGLTSWKVYDAGLATLSSIYETFEEVPQDRKQHNNPSMFCQPQVENLNCCMRFFPQDYDSGGFFVTVLHKKEEFERLTKPRSKKQKPLREAPYIPITQGNTEIMEKIMNTFGFDDEFPRDQLFVRNEQSVHNVVFVNKSIADLIAKHGSEAFRTISSGAPIFTWRNFSRKSSLPYPAMEGVEIIRKYAHKRLFTVKPEEMLRLLISGHHAVAYNDLSAETFEQFKNVESTGALFYIPDTPIAYGGMTFKGSIAIYLRKDLLPVEKTNLLIAYPELEKVVEEIEKDVEEKNKNQKAPKNENDEETAQEKENEEDNANEETKEE
ncbi:Multisite-specific tRNA:(cytosine-C(5))-methyltransferase trm4a [Tritrichomonas foetus]|uniref:Multisite-specific tRNA:(Cytosine-C(5))-methyltransferase trm4a n=1 Tax=Tritrichomonas foetus TaxID=1144522 RepID=A0A1J4K4G7_9EUKA|nr:Multisite-specific tRNA:(cytosine-C(5))-methyltransferase trm4a [Tritrichomonas foetus]|eukprot:OHT05736.1 Multisite-specific tRNA:(cytosine-C(5))-methyltransferase trm4a [Tritrichomonas foetus]